MKFQTKSLSLFLSLLFFCSLAQADEFRVDAQVYPAGLIGTLHYHWSLSETMTLGLGGGGNYTDRRDWGEHDNESGEGYGGSPLFTHRLPWLNQKTFWGARLDLWNLDINWTDPGQSGSTDALVLQPTFEFGYRFDLSKKLSLSPSLAGGMEINLKEDGQEVGEGPIGLFRLTFHYVL